MARLQIVTLPTLTVGVVSETEFLIVIDEVDEEFGTELMSFRDVDITAATGARGILIFQSTIEVVR